MMPESKIHIVGVSGNSLTAEGVALIGPCSLLIVSDALRPVVSRQLPDYPLSRIVPVLPLPAALAAIEEGLARGDVAVLASGDPLFFGIGALLGTRFNPQRLRVAPAISSMQLAFARMGLPWQDAKFLSLHGRKRTPLARQILAFPKVCILTDRHNTPASIARELLETLTPAQIRTCQCFVGEDLGGRQEGQTRGPLDEIAKRQFKEPNVMIVLQEDSGTDGALVFGLREDELAHSRGLITKDEIRAAVIHALALPRRGVLWDLGAGSGSVGIEAARLAEGLEVYAVERHDEQLAHIAANRRRFAVLNLEPVKGEAPEALQLLPDPDRVFIGGSGGNLAGIIDAAAGRLKAGGRIVVSAVLEKTSVEAPPMLHAHGLEVEIKRIEVSRQRYPLTEIVRLNPIAIVSGRKI